MPVCFECSGCCKVLTRSGMQVLKLLYDHDVVEEAAVIKWADEKELAEQHERVYLDKASEFVTWLREAEEEEEEEEGEVSEGDED